MFPIIEIKNVSKSFGNKAIYQNVSYDIEEGACVGFVGGKVIAGGNFPDDVGIMINELGYISAYSGYKNLCLLAELKGIVSEAEIKEAMNTVGLSPDDKTPVRKYSMGMKQKLGIVQA